MSLSQLLCIWRVRRAKAARARRSRSLPRRNALRIEPLEPRLLLSADPLVIDPALDSTTEVSSGVLVEAVTAVPQAVAGGPQEGPAAKKPGVAGAGAVAEEDPDDASSTELIVAGALQDATALAQTQLGLFAGDPAFVEKMALAFGDGADATQFQSAWSAGDFSILSGVDIRTAAELGGAQGAYALSTDQIYLSREFVEANASAVERIAGSLLEEAGHRLDGRLNASDSPGDEGEIFSALARGEPLSDERLAALRAEDDHATITLDGEALLVERASARLFGGRGADLLIGDNDLRVAGLAGHLTGSGRAHMEIERLLDDVTLAGGRDWREGGPGDDDLVGDNHAHVAGVAGTVDWEAAEGIGDKRSGKERRHAPVRIELKKLVDDLTLAGAADWLEGGVGADRLVGDHVTAVLAGIGASPAHGRRVAITVRELLDDLYIKGGADQLHGGRGADVLLGDSRMMVADRGLLDRLRIRGGNDRLGGGNGDDRLFGQQGCDRLRGGRGDDALVGGSGRDCLDGGPGDDSLNQGGTDSPHDVAVDLSVTAVRALDSRVFTPNPWVKRFVLDLAETQDDFDSKQALRVVLPNNYS